MTGVQKLKPPAGKNDSAKSLVDICWATAHSQARRPSLRARDRLHAPRGDPDPSRCAVGHGNGDFARRAWRDHAVLPDSVAELPFGGGAVLAGHSFRRSRSDLDRSAGKLKPASGSDHIETSCKTLPQHMRHRMSLVKARILALSGLAISVTPSQRAARFCLTRCNPSTFRHTRCAGRLWICGQRKSVAHIPTGAAINTKHQFDCAGFRPNPSSPRLGPATLQQYLPPSLRGFGQPLTPRPCRACFARCESWSASDASPLSLTVVAGAQSCSP